MDKYSFARQWHNQNPLLDAMKEKSSWDFDRDIHVVLEAKVDGCNRSCPSIPFFFPPWSIQEWEDIQKSKFWRVRHRNANQCNWNTFYSFQTSFVLLAKSRLKTGLVTTITKKLCSTFEFSHQKSTLQSKENSNETFLIIFTHFLTAIRFTIAILQVTFHLLIVDFLVTRALLSLNCFWKVKVLGMLCESRSWIWKAFSVLFKTKMRIFLSINAF